MATTFNVFLSLLLLLLPYVFSTCNPAIFILRPQALQISQVFLDSGWIEPLLNHKDTVFKDDFVLYASGRVSNIKNIRQLWECIGQYNVPILLINYLKVILKII